MANMNEILHREIRTAISLPKIDRRSASSSRSSDSCEDCDKNQKSENFARISRRKFKGSSLEFSKNFRNCVSVAVSISLFLLLIAQSEAKPAPSAHPTHHHRDHSHGNHSRHHHHQHSSHVHNHKPRAINCKAKMPENGQSVSISDPEFPDRLQPLMIACEYALDQTKKFIGPYVQAIWGKNVEAHHAEWSQYAPEYLYPDGEMLKKEFNKSIDDDHKAELESINWKERANVLEHLAKIYQRLERIYIGIQFVNEWIKLVEKSGNAPLNSTQLSKSRDLYKSVFDSISDVLCEIREILLNSMIDPKSDFDIRPFNVEASLEGQFKLEQWYIYREYQNVMEYSKILLEMILDRYKE